MPQIAMREMCALCHRVVRVGFWVPDYIWAEVVHPSRINDIHCLECFTVRADEKLIDWSKDIRFYPVSLRLHLQADGVCRWMEWDNSGTWNTSCGQGFPFAPWGTICFCPNCGKRIQSMEVQSP